MWSASQIIISNYVFNYWLTTFKGAEMRFFKYLFFGVLFIPILLGQGPFNLNGPHDLNRNGITETFILNDNDKSIQWLEFEQLSEKKELWSYNLSYPESFLDIEILDINNDGFQDIVALLDISLSINKKEWLYVFLGNEQGYPAEPIKIDNLNSQKNFIRPANLTILSGSLGRLVVALGATVREVMIFEIKISGERGSLSNIEYISEPNTNNGSSPLYVGSFTNRGVNYLSLISCENDELKISTFDIEGKSRFINSSIYSLKGVKQLFGSNIQEVNIKSLKQNGVVIPFKSNEAFILAIREKKPTLFKTNSHKEYYPVLNNSKENLIPKILNNRFNLDVVFDHEIVPHSIYSRLEKGVLLPPNSPKKEDVSTLNSTLKYSKENNTSLPKESKKANIQLLNPTLGDFLRSVKNNTPAKESDDEKIAIPDIDNNMESMNWADEAGFTKIDLNEYMPNDLNVDTTVSVIPNVNNKMDITRFSQKEWDSNSKRKMKDTITSGMNTENQIELYYVLAITPASNKRDRFIFDGEIPFGVSVNQIPPTGEPTHFKHGISANLKGLSKGNEYDFAYSIRDAKRDSITTFKMVHDMQTNLVYMKRSVLLNGILVDIDKSDSKSYQPEAFNPKLFEFPNYFFEGFPTSLDMDFTDKLIRFSFDDSNDSLYSGIYLSSTTPSDPSQSLAVFMEEGKLQAIRGEVEVYPNGKKRITTEFDLVGIVDPRVLFSRLIEEKFSEDLKMKILQGASLEEPLFGPSGKLPKVSREPRLPEAQPDQPEFEIPVTPKQSIIPKLEKIENPIQKELGLKIKESSQDASLLENLSEPSVPSDSLKLENIKTPYEDEPAKLEKKVEK